jgi:hypothetical protein
MEDQHIATCRQPLTIEYGSDGMWPDGDDHWRVISSAYVMGGGVMEDQHTAACQHPLTIEDGRDEMQPDGDDQWLVIRNS